MSKDIELITTAELASLLRISRQTVNNWLKLGLPSFKVANTRRFELCKVFSWLNSKKAPLEKLERLANIHSNLK